MGFVVQRFPVYRRFVKILHGKTRRNAQKRFCPNGVHGTAKRTVLLCVVVFLNLIKLFIIFSFRRNAPVGIFVTMMLSDILVEGNNKDPMLATRRLPAGYRQSPFLCSRRLLIFSTIRQCR